VEDLVRGLEEFKQSYVAKHHALFEELAHGQKPRVLFITCSDSRIAPNLLTQTDLGELFVIRNAGNIIPPYGAANGGEGATLEYAISALGIEQVIICGHSHCGAMKGLLKLNQLQEGMPLVYDWLKHAESTRRMVVDNYPDAQGEELVEILVAENVLIQIDNLKTYPVVRSRLQQGKLQIYAWVYHIETGEVLAYDAEAHTYLPPQSLLSEGAFAQSTAHPKYRSTHAPPVACEIPPARQQQAAASQKNGAVPPSIPYRFGVS
jgi:carbonic anhydrase